MTTILYIAIGIIVIYGLGIYLVVRSNNKILAPYKAKPAKLSKEADYFLDKHFKKIQNDLRAVSTVG